MVRLLPTPSSAGCAVAMQRKAIRLASTTRRAFSSRVTRHKEDVRALKLHCSACSSPSLASLTSMTLPCSAGTLVNDYHAKPRAECGRSPRRTRLA